MEGSTQSSGMDRAREAAITKIAQAIMEGGTPSKETLKLMADTRPLYMELVDAGINNGGDLTSFLLACLRNSRRIDPTRRRRLRSVCSELRDKSGPGRSSPPPSTVRRNMRSKRPVRAT